jgi:pSer/pThr/pTyr-binding forkhead associated (FHA) protein
MDAESNPPPALILPNGARTELGATNVIGRSRSCHVVLHGQDVSRQHAHIYEMNGHFYIVDKESSNGTYLNKMRVTHPSRLDNGDVISVGGHELRFLSRATPLPNSITTVTMNSDRTMVATIRQMKTWLLLVDVIGSTQLIHSLSPDEYAQRLGVWFRNCRGTVELFDGSVNQATGDGLVAYWFDEDDSKSETVLRAVTALRRFQAEATLPFRWLLHHGTVGVGAAASMGEESFSGREMHYLFRMEKALDRTWEMAISHPAAQRLECFCPMTLLGELPIKGFAEAARLFRPEFAPSEP